MLRQSRIIPWLALIATLSLAAGRAHAQCTITGPASMCGSPVTLCAPDGGELYEWTLPDGSHQWDQCVTASMAGTYSVRVFDPHLGDWTSPCTHELAGSGAAPGISGPASGCTGATVELCGPAGSFEYEWTGPSGFMSGEACAVVSEAGSYSLRVRPLPDGCWSEWASREVAFSTCGDPPLPDPDPTPVGESCPRPAWWWAQQCPDHDRSGMRLDPNVMSQISSCVDDHAADLDGTFCRTMLAGHRTLGMRARRQVAAVWANVCAGELGVRSRDGRPVSLDEATAVHVGDYHGTVGSWLGTASATLSAMGGSTQSKAEREEYKRIIRVAWHINHGLGIGRACSPTGDAPAGGVSLASETNAMSAMDDLEPLAAELMDDSPSALAFASVQNPVRERMTMAYAVQTAAPSDVSIGVYDVSGRLVRELVRGSMAPGSYVTQWDGRDEDGVPVRGGVYFVFGRIDGQRAQTRVTLVR